VEQKFSFSGAKDKTKFVMVDFLLKDDKVIRKGEGYGDAIQQ
jgi:hypothetical protein